MPATPQAEAACGETRIRHARPCPPQRELRRGQPERTIGGKREPKSRTFRGSGWPARDLAPSINETLTTIGEMPGFQFRASINADSQQYRPAERRHATRWRATGRIPVHGQERADQPEPDERHCGCTSPTFRRRMPLQMHPADQRDRKRAARPGQDRRGRKRARSPQHHAAGEIPAEMVHLADERDRSAENDRAHPAHRSAR